MNEEADKFYAENYARLLKERDLPLRERYPEYEIGVGSYGGVIVRKWDEKTKLSIGNYCSFSFDVQIFLGGEHRTDWVTTFPFSQLWPEAKHIEGHPKSRGDVRIGNDVWVGAGACIMSGVTIGDGAVIGARSVVLGSVPPYTIFAGHPTKFIGKRFPEHVIEELSNIKWWNWPRERIVGALPFLLNRDIEGFIEAYKTGEI